MPELPEVETTRRGILPLLGGHSVVAVEVRNPRLRWPVRPDLPELLIGQRLDDIERRAKYLLFRFATGTLLLHLGMSGSLRVLSAAEPPGAHDHLDIRFDARSDAGLLRLRDPRRFGAALWLEGDGADTPLLRHLGPEPLSAAFDGAYLYRQSRERRSAIKTLLMDQKIVTGVGNIYANEALFRAGVRPQRRAGSLSRDRAQRLTDAVKQILAAAIAQGGTTLRDFQQSDGRPGYFAQSLQVYGRDGQACPGCGAPIRLLRIGQRSSFYCPSCQK